MGKKRLVLNHNRRGSRKPHAVRPVSVKVNVNVINVYAFKTPLSGGAKLVVSGSVQPTLKSGVTVSGGSTYFEGMLLVGPTVSGGTDVSLTSYTSGGGGGGWH